MKKLFLFLILAVSLTANAQQQPVRCTAMTIWGQCTNEAMHNDTICILHSPKESQPVQQSTTLGTLSSRPATQSKTSTEDTVAPAQPLTTPQRSTTTRTQTTTRATTTATRSTATRSYPTRCQARTKNGGQCTRNAQPNSYYCWQHRR